MAAVFSAAAHAPITSVLILFELTGDYRIILPLMLTVVIATVISQRLLRGESIYTLKLSRRNIRLSRGRDRDILQGVQVMEVMTTEVPKINTNATLREIARFFSSSHYRSQFVVDDQDRLLGIVTISDLERARESGVALDAEVLSIMTAWPDLLVAYPDESVGIVLARMGTQGIGQLPVVSRNDNRLIRGLISRIGITKAYTLALSRRTEIGLKTEDMERQFKDEARFTQIVLRPNDFIVGKRLIDISDRLPKDCIFVSIQRNGRTVIPHGDTVFREGDKLRAFLNINELETLHDVVRDG
jgi:CIC family chloride channel protein